jgi:imidazolonepropionase-like amidohydrolase
MIDGGGRTLIPGLTDAHVHIMWNDDIEDLIYNAPEGYSGALAAVNARNMLLRGFTTAHGFLTNILIKKHSPMKRIFL